MPMRIQKSLSMFFAHVAKEHYYHWIINQVAHLELNDTSTTTTIGTQGGSRFGSRGKLEETGQQGRYDSALL